MPVRGPSGGWRWAPWVCLGLGLASGAFAADPLPYRLSIAPTGNVPMDRALVDASRLAGLRERAPVGPFALIARAESDTDRLDTVLRSFGYYDALVNIRIAGREADDPALLPLLEGLPAAPPVAVAVAVDPGPLYRLGSVRLEGPVPEGVRRVFDLRPGQPARARDVLDAGEAVLTALKEDGFALARLPPPEALVDHGTRTMDVLFRAEPGQRLALGEISVVGLDRLRESYVRRRLGLVPGEPFSPSRLEEARRALLDGGALAWARLTPASEPDGQGRLPLTLELAERPPRVVRVAGAFSSDEGMTLSASWTHRNLFGGAERLTLNGEISQLLDESLGEPNYLATASLRLPDLGLRDLDLRLDLGAVSERLDAYDREALTAGLALERRFSRRLSASGGLAFERSRIAQDGPAQDYRLLALPLTLARDTTDDPLDPRRGTRLDARLSPARVLDGETSGFSVARVAGSGYLDLTRILEDLAAQDASSETAPGIDVGTAAPAPGRRAVLAGRVVLGSILGASVDEVPPDWRFYAGGGGSVRGYPFQSIGPETPSGSPAGGGGLLEGSLELRLRLGERWGAAVFADAGAVSEGDVPGAGALALGVGLGLRWFTPIGPVRADIAAPANRNPDGSTVQLYIGIGQAF